MKPMLAFKYAINQKHLTWPAFTQPKLDGVRAVYRDGAFYSRDLERWNENVVAHLLAAVEDIPKEVVLDGEFYVHGWKLQEINSAISVVRKEPSSQTFSVEYHVFDCLLKDFPTMPFVQRHQIMLDTLEGIGRKVKPVSTYHVEDNLEFEKKYRDFRNAGFEGSMWRKSDAPYGLEQNCGNKENRWKVLLKRKEWLDAWFPCVGSESGKGKFETSTGALTCLTSDGKPFTVGSGLSDAEREQYRIHFPKLVHVQFETYSIDGIPLKPVFIEAK
jgi:DNA ligase-1